ncbi:hypothetical protein MHLP_01860 [Candidatus Mycoplasma haematolamae str. Purdue]|uniref:Ig-like domain-containing protein n=1 Tax=Mycoplasma haematolamae (strain Purdue) TaxID=1212765 RepID=I7C645_MYCHA|nr:hypothetical protein [Candidatus Mycoplasma haematolamae]AFO51952.1 hypothetical protein MHLP_01860 [Candidatus Mycoplasma haematolamae str. Purdue]
MSVFLKAISCVVALGGGASVVAGASGAFSDGGRVFSFVGAKNGKQNLYCSPRSNQFAKPKAEKEGKKLICDYENDDGVVTEIRWDSIDNGFEFQCIKSTSGIFECKAQNNRSFSLEKKYDNSKGEEYLEVSIDAQ